MKRTLIAFIDRIRADLAEAAQAVENDDLDEALDKFGSVALRIETQVSQLRKAA